MYTIFFCLIHGNDVTVPVPDAMFFALTITMYGNWYRYFASNGTVPNTVIVTRRSYAAHLTSKPLSIL